MCFHTSGLVHSIKEWKSKWIIFVVKSRVKRRFFTLGHGWTYRVNGSDTNLDSRSKHPTYTVVHAVHKVKELLLTCLSSCALVANSIITSIQLIPQLGTLRKFCTFLFQDFLGVYRFFLR